jgi:hypothetical protein
MLVGAASSVDIIVPHITTRASCQVIAHALHCIWSPGPDARVASQRGSLGPTNLTTGMSNSAASRPSGS